MTESAFTLSATPDKGVGQASVQNQASMLETAHNRLRTQAGASNLSSRAASADTAAMPCGNNAPSDDILRVENLNVWIANAGDYLHIVHDASFAVKRGQRWGIAGESGAGKSMMIKAISALLPDGSTRIEGRILYRLQDGSWLNLLEMPYKKRHAFLSKRVAVIFQDSIHALNPNERISKQWGDTVKLHHPRISKNDCVQYLLGQMDVFGIRGNTATLRSYPHQLSGGMRQRIAIAMALESQSNSGFSESGPNAGKHDGIIIADEPTTSLDSTTQRSVVNYIRNICESRGETLLYVSHNLGVLQHICDHLMVLKDGWIVELGPIDDLCFRASHPYTRQIIAETLKIMGKEAC